ncbi:hypothetical protein PtA15_11A130 [Puccinia triticina]|uniref:G-protein coupled receptors family 1 profile domain-containing protein n=1 Tax=Puccinia triticina TaxID=208348 RepID=A0ABY7D3B8_9BASI|nr:uncharacterized protein PtA15_11A130 [Puccinia triticina]WAQ89442.1 hypothetical protein PtA15_11A130 [Puccinia triticina]
MAALTQDLVDFVTSLPPSVNPYEATAEKVKQETKMAQPVLWGLVLRRITTFLFFTFFCQAVVVLILRKKAKQLKFFRYNKLGLIHVEVLNEMVLLMLIFSLLAWIDLITQEFVELRLVRFSRKIVLHTCKFPVAAIVCCSLGARARAGASIKLSPLRRFALNGLLVTVIVVPGALLLWISILAAFNLSAIESTTRKIVVALLQNAPSYRPETYNYLSVVEILKPMETVSDNIKRLTYLTRFMLLLYLVQHSLIAVFYLPTWVIVLRGLRKQTVPEQLQGGASLQISSHVSNTDKLCAPTPKVSHFNDPTFVLVEQVFNHGPTALIGNVIMAFLIQNALYSAKKATDVRNVEADAAQNVVKLKQHIRRIINM